MSMRMKGILLGAGFLVLVVLWFVLLFRPSQSEIAELREQQEATEREISSLEARLTRLQELREQEPQLRAEFARMEDALPADPRLPDFILQVHEAANLAGIDFLSISPSLPADFNPPEGAPPAEEELSGISVSISAEGSYFALEDFIIRIERLRRAVRINSFSLSPVGEPEVPGTSPDLSVTFSTQMFMLGGNEVAELPPPDTVDPDAEPDEDEEDTDDGAPVEDDGAPVEEE